MVHILKKISNKEINMEIEDSIDHHRKWYILEGSIFLFLATLVAFLPVLTVFTFVTVIGSSLLIEGFFRFVQLYRAAHKRCWHELVNLLYTTIRQLNLCADLYHRALDYCRGELKSLLQEKYRKIDKELTHT